MKTSKMIENAKQTGATYESSYGTYNVNDGFKFNSTVDGMPYELFASVLCCQDLWKEQEVAKKMTLADIEKALGYKVEIIKEKKSKNDRDIDDFMCSILDVLEGR